MTEFELPQKKLQRVQPENAKDGYLYFQLDTGDGSANAPCSGRSSMHRFPWQLLAS